MAFKRRRRFRGRRRRRGRKMNLRRKVNIALARSKPELKHRSDNATFNPTVSVITDIMPTVDQGVKKDERIGQWIYARSMTMKCQLSWNVSSTQFMTTMRLIVFRWRGKDLPSTGEILDNTLFPTSLYALPTAGQYQILHDKYHRCGRQGNSAFINYFNLYFRLGKRLSYAGPSDNVANNWRYAILTIGDDNDAPTFQYFTRLSFYDQ